MDPSAWNVHSMGFLGRPVQHKCYRGSVTQSLAMALGQAGHRSTWTKVSRFLTTSPRMMESLVSAGVDRSAEWKPTFAEDLGRIPLKDSRGVLFVGRLDPAKGVELLLNSWTSTVAERWGSLSIAGAGPLAQSWRLRASHDPSIVWRGTLSPAEVRAAMAEAQLIAIPSIWFEGFPRVAAGGGFPRPTSYSLEWYGVQ